MKSYKDRLFEAFKTVVPGDDETTWCMVIYSDGATGERNSLMVKPTEGSDGSPDVMVAFFSGEPEGDELARSTLGHVGSLEPSSKTAYVAQLDIRSALALIRLVTAAVEATNMVERDPAE